jgi:hypothetical protein
MTQESKHLSIGIIIGLLIFSLGIFVNKMLRTPVQIPAQVEKIIDNTNTETLIVQKDEPANAPDSPDATWFWGPWRDLGWNSDMRSVNIRCNNDAKQCTVAAVNVQKVIPGKEAVSIAASSFPLFYITEPYEKKGRIVAEANDISADGTSLRLVIDYNLGTIELFKTTDESGKLKEPKKLGEMILKPSEHIYPFKPTR